MKDKVLKFRKKLSVELRHHKKNRVRPVGPIHVLPKPAVEADASEVLPKPAGEADAGKNGEDDALVSPPDASEVIPKPAGEADAGKNGEDGALVSPPDASEVLPKPAGEADARKNGEDNASEDDALIFTTRKANGQEESS
jgi:hypothetical protein